MDVLRCLIRLVTVAALGSGGAVSADDFAAERERMAEAILGRAEAAMGRAFDPAFRADAHGRLARLALEELKAREGREVWAGLGPLGGGSGNPMLVYHSLPPCRIIDTRVAGGSLPVGTPRDFKVAGTGHQGQGGSIAGCGVPTGAAAAAVINFVAVNPTGAGNLRAWAYSVPPVAPPLSSIINYAFVAGANLNIANGIVVPLCDPSGSVCDFDLKVQADGSGTHLVADVLGYFSPLSPVTTILQKAPSLTVNTAVPSTACTHVAGGEVTITVPAAGQVEVSAVVGVRLSHAMGVTIDLMNLHFATTTTDCTFAGGYGQAWVQSSQPTGNYTFSVPVIKVFTVPAAGSYTYYLNASMESGGDAADMVEGDPTLIRAVFHPNAP